MYFFERENVHVQTIERTSEVFVPIGIGHAVCQGKVLQLCCTLFYKELTVRCRRAKLSCKIQNKRSIADNFCNISSKKSLIVPKKSLRFPGNVSKFSKYQYFKNVLRRANPEQL